MSHHHPKKTDPSRKVVKDTTPAQLLILAIIMVAVITVATGMGYINLSATDAALMVEIV